jgi:hypothetical protein
MALGQMDESQVAWTNTTPALACSADVVGGSSAIIGGLKVKFDATAAPTGAASFAAGYSIGSLWFWPGSQKLYICYGDAEWQEVAMSTAGLLALAALTPTRGDIIVANSDPAWTELAKGAAYKPLNMGSGGNDPEYSTLQPQGGGTGQTTLALALAALLGEVGGTPGAGKAIVDVDGAGDYQWVAIGGGVAKEFLFRGGYSAGSVAGTSLAGIYSSYSHFHEFKAITKSLTDGVKYRATLTHYQAPNVSSNADPIRWGLRVSNGATVHYSSHHTSSSGGTAASPGPSTSSPTYPMAGAVVEFTANATGTWTLKIGGWDTSATGTTTNFYGSLELEEIEDVA